LLSLVQDLPVEETVSADLQVETAGSAELRAALDDEFVLALLTLTLCTGFLPGYFTHEDPQHAADEVAKALRCCIKVALNQVRWVLNAPNACRDGNKAVSLAIGRGQRWLLDRDVHAFQCRSKHWRSTCADSGRALC
jgi:hypothetical protein